MSGTRFETRMSLFEDLQYVDPDIAREVFAEQAERVQAHEEQVRQRYIESVESPEVAAKIMGIKMAQAYVDYTNGVSNEPFRGHFVLTDDFHELAHSTFRHKLALKKVPAGEERQLQAIRNGIGLWCEVGVSADTILTAQYTSGPIST